MTRPTPSRPVTAARFVLAHDALSAVLALEEDLLSAEAQEVLLRAQEVLEDLQLELGRRVEVVAVHGGLGPCNNCPEDVRAGDECSTCLEELAVVRHVVCCAGECFQ